jgi:hypothetical protein
MPPFSKFERTETGGIQHIIVVTDYNTFLLKILNALLDTRRLHVWRTPISVVFVHDLRVHDLLRVHV